MQQSSLRRTWPIIVYAIIASMVVLSVFYVAFFSPQARAVHHVSEEATRSGFMFTESIPQNMSAQQKFTDYTKLVSTPGAIIGVKEHSIERLDTESEETIWEYKRPGGEICDAIGAWGDVVVVYNMGKGCTDVTRLDGATGQYVAQASYATDQDVLKMVFSDDKLALVTPRTARVLRDDLVTMTEFGQQVDFANKTPFANCDIYDATISPKALVVSNKCNGSETTHVTAVEVDPDDSSAPETIVDVDTHSSDPVTTPVATLAQMKFITQGSDPVDYTWQIDKDLTEVAASPVRQGEYGLWGDSFDGIGYVWIIGNKMYARYGSEDVSQFTSEFKGATTNPLEADHYLLVGTEQGFSFWDTHENIRHDVSVDEDVSAVKKIAFAGDTVATFNDGTITMFKPSEV